MSITFQTVNVETAQKNLKKSRAYGPRNDDFDNVIEAGLELEPGKSLKIPKMESKEASRMRGFIKRHYGDKLKVRTTKVDKKNREVYVFRLDDIKDDEEDDEE